MILLGLMQRVLALLSLVLIGAGAYQVWSWWDLEQTVRAVDPDLDASNTRLYVGLALLAWSILGRLPVLLLAGKPGGERQRFERSEGRMLTAADGASIRTESYGPSTAPTLILTHGWGLDSTIWIEAKRQLAQRYRLVVWDLPGLGRSGEPEGDRYSLDGFAADLRTLVAAEASHGPVLLVGHSIGGMTVQTFCRNYPEMLGKEVAGIVLENTSHTNPIRTMALNGLFLPLQKPLIEPMMKLDTVLSPLLWAMNWQSYLSGATHIAARLAGFGSQPTWGQLDQTARLITQSSPGVQAKGNLAMMHWSVTDALPTIRVPALVFAGGRDIITLPQAGETIRQTIPGARGVTIEEAGHMGPVERALDYNRAIESFADEVLMAGAFSVDAERYEPVIEDRPPQPRGLDGAGDGVRLQP